VIRSKGLLAKGDGLYHRVAGNAPSLLLLVDPVNPETGMYLAVGLAMLHEVRSTPRFVNEHTRLRMPDHPWSLFKGLAGTNMCMEWGSNMGVNEAEGSWWAMRAGIGIMTGKQLRACKKSCWTYLPVNRSLRT
jgi:hypothetical protein